MNKYTGGPAFPSGMMEPSKPDDAVHAVDKGMTLRDYFAAKALQGMMADGRTGDDYVASLAYQYADAMLKAREQ